MQDTPEPQSDVEQERQSLSTMWALAPCILLEDEVERTARMLEQLHWGSLDE